MAGKDLLKQKQNKSKNGGMFRMAPGCSNSFHTVKDRETPVYFHNLPKKRPTLPLASGDEKEYCTSQQFSKDNDYVEEKFFNEEGRLATH